MWAVVLLLVLVPPLAQAQLLLGEAEDPYPLRPADTSSPRDTLRSFMLNFTQAVEAWDRDRPREMILRPAYRAADTLDFSEIPVVGRESAVLLNMAMLREILDRVELPSYSEIPGDRAVAGETAAAPQTPAAGEPSAAPDTPPAEDEAVWTETDAAAAKAAASAKAAAEAPVSRWTIPNTKIEIVKMEEGPRAGQFLFSKEAVENIPRYYQMVKDLPYKPGALVGIYDRIRTAPGTWVSHRLPENLPAWARMIVWGQGIWQWISLLIVLVMAAALIFVVLRLGTAWDAWKGQGRPWLSFGVPLALLVVVAIANAVESITRNAIGLLGPPENAVAIFVLCVSVLALSWFAIAVSGRLAEAIGQRKHQTEERRRFTTAFLRIVFRLISLIFLVLLGVGAAEALGIPLAPLLAGVGVGGLAIALAVRPTLENVIGGLTLFADRPVRVGDFCLYGDKVGTVEEIGLRSTRIRTLERSVVTVSNAEFSQLQLDNFTRRDQRLLHTTLQLRYETTPDQMRHILIELRKMLLGHPMVMPEPARVRLVAFGAYSKDLEVFAYVDTADHDTFLAIQEDLLLRMEDIVLAAGSGFAFPSQTAYLTRDGGLDADQREQAEQDVEDLRVRGKLPFPEFEDEEREGLEDTLDYPPRGSPHYQSPVSRPGPAAKPKKRLDETAPDEPDGDTHKGADKDD